MASRNPCDYKDDCADCEYQLYCQDYRGDNDGHKPSAEELARVLMCGDDICTYWGFHCETGFCDRAQAMIAALSTPAEQPHGPQPTDPVCMEYRTINGKRAPVTYYGAMKNICHHPSRDGQPCVGQRDDACPLKKTTPTSTDEVRCTQH